MKQVLYADRARVQAEFAGLTAIDSESYHEREMADCLTGKLRELGFTVAEDGAGAKIGGSAGNLLAVLKGQLPGPPVLLSGHMDTVRPGTGKRAVFHEDGTVTSGGDTVLGGDDMAGVTAILEGIRITRQAGLPHRDLEVVFHAAEEPYCRGSGAFDFSGLKAKAGYVLDASGPVGTAILKAPTILSFQVSIRGRAAHAGFEPEKGIHAIALMSRAISSLRMGRLDDGTTLNIGLMEGGSVTNAVPALCTAKGEIRSYRHDRALAALEDLKKTFEQVTEGTGAALELDSTVHIHAFEISEQEPVVR